VRLSPHAQKAWGRLFDRYLDYRVQRGFEKEKVPEQALRYLADYVALALPSKCSFGELPIRLPVRPADFRRSEFIDPRDAALHGASFLTYVRRRYPSTDSVYATLYQAWQFFEFIALHYGDEASADIAGPGFVNPISKDFDLPRIRGARSRGTNKLPFGRTVVPHLVLWL
jgi:hypothetical protein